MTNLFLTQSGGLLGPIASLLGWILNVIYEFLSMFHIENAALCIVLFTFIVKSLMIPLTVKQQKFTKISSKMNPELMKIQEKYKGKRDEISMRKQQLETQAVYQKYGASPTSGCLPMLITLPILFALYQVIYRIPAYIGDIYNLYENIATGLKDTPNFATILADNLHVTGLSADSSIKSIIDALTKFTSGNWSELAKAFPGISDTIASNSDKIIHINSFVGGLNIADNPLSKAIPGLIVPILAVATQWYSTKQMTAANGMDKNAPGAASMKAMNTFMPLFSGFICLSLPIGIGIYWVAGSVFQIIQQFAINKHFEKVDIDELVEKSVEKAKKKKKHVDYEATLQELAKKQTKSIGDKAGAYNNVTNKKSSISSKANSSASSKADQTDTNDNRTYKAGSIAEKANLLKGMNSSGKGEK
ncbi:YidC/Oxa1 family membrane protein insertase [Anaerosporobacter faecicola]|uniref:YidC/Oxa1 family membrane protein insertase n=1 Tax=Anaerosporobacter faecicola TaxID=2718714 RepID=UPI0014389282|nr:YidC/Oxa1 family membrane protein insertase [Anaerosporobacter faecicola]